MKTSSSESFHSTTSQPSPISGTISGIISGTLSGTISGSPPPPDTISHVKDKQLGVPLTTTLTIHNVGQLNNQCQALGLNAHYEVDGDQQTGFGGFLRLGSQTITMDERWPTKKAAREGLAKNGLAVVRDLKRRKAEDERSVENWIGLLNSKREKLCYSLSFCPSLCRQAQSSQPSLFLLLALSRLPPNLRSNGGQRWPYLH